MQGGRGALDAGPRAHAAVGAAQVFGLERDGVHQRQERNPQCAGVWREAAQLCGAALLDPLRRIGFRDPQAGEALVFLTKNFTERALTIAQLYRYQWRIELFFK